MDNRTVIPSHLSVGRTPAQAPLHAYNNQILRIGEVQKVWWPDDKNNFSKTVPEYDVLVSHRDGMSGTTMIYANCTLQSIFGSIADLTSWGLRIPETPSAAIKNNINIGKGTKVLLLCVNGETANAIILGGLKDGNDDGKIMGKAPKDLGQYYYTRYNGIEHYINDDGEYKVTYTGKSKIDGTTDVGSSDQGSYLFLGLKGKAQLADKDAKNAVTIDHENSKVTVSIDKGFEIGSASDKMILGSTYRDKEHSMNNDLKQGFSDLFQYILQASIYLTACAVPLKIPVTGGIAASPLIQQAATQLQQASQSLQKMQMAINTFESSSDKYLSSKCKLQ